MSHEPQASRREARAASRRVPFFVLVCANAGEIARGIHITASGGTVNDAGRLVALRTLATIQRTGVTTTQKLGKARAALFSLARSTTGMTFSLLTCTRISGGSVLGPPLISGGPNLASSQNPGKHTLTITNLQSSLQSVWPKSRTT